jgi:uncharacterized protein (DUF983 family)
MIEGIMKFLHWLLDFFRLGATGQCPHCRETIYTSYSEHYKRCQAYWEHMAKIGWGKCGEDGH